MAQGQAIGPEIENLIGEIHDKHRKWKAPKVWHEVESILRERAVKDHKEVQNEPGEFLSLSKVQHVLTNIRRNERTPSRLDKPWSIYDGIAEGVEISTDALPFVLEVWIFMKDAWNHDLTIREARWLDRLHNVAQVALTNLGPEAASEDRSRVMLQFLKLAGIYATGERVAELTGRRTTSLALDFTVWQILTGQTGSPELTDKLFTDRREIMVQTQDDLVVRATKKDMAFVRKVNKLLKVSESENHLFRFELDETGGQDNDRTIRQTAKAERHRQHRTTKQR